MVAEMVVLMAVSMAGMKAETKAFASVARMVV